MPKLRIITIAVGALALAALPSVASARHGHHRRSRGQVTVSGTIASFKGGVLTITRPDQTSVSGQVTPATEIECLASGPPTARMADRGGSGDGLSGASGRGGDDNVPATDGEAAGAPAPETVEDQGATQPGDPNTPPQPVGDATALVPGTTVTRAKTRINDAGAAVFTQIKLARQKTRTARDPHSARTAVRREHRGDSAEADDVRRTRSG